MNTSTQKLLDFIEKSPTAFQTVCQMKQQFLDNGFVELFENQRWKIQPNGKYFVTRNHSALIAFSIPGRIENVDNIANNKMNHKFHIVASHSDSPTFKIKEDPEIVVGQVYTKLNVEKYGGMIMSSWFDRPLSIAGRIVIEKDDGICEMPVHIERDLLLIPNLAIHMDRKANEGYAYNAQKDMLPLIGSIDGDSFDLKAFLASELNLDASSILSHDLFLYNRMPGTVWGVNQEFVSSPRLDDLQCAFSSMEAILQAKCTNAIAVHCVLDNEEVGSSSKQGAASTFLKETLKRIVWGLGGDEEDYFTILADSFMISADNAHAIHPNHMEKADPTNQPVINKGIVIKYNANQRYCTDSVSAARFMQLCHRSGVPYQTFANRSDIPGGSTLGNISNTQVPVNTVDIGLPQLAMHSAYETAGVLDTEYLIKVLTEFWK